MTDQTLNTANVATVKVSKKCALTNIPRACFKNRDYVTFENENNGELLEIGDFLLKVSESDSVKFTITLDENRIRVYVNAGKFKDRFIYNKTGLSIIAQCIGFEYKLAYQRTENKWNVVEFAEKLIDYINSNSFKNRF